MKTGLAFLAVAALGAGASACAMVPAAHVHQARAARPGPQESNIVVHYPPPPEEADPRPESPGPEYVWAPGYWLWSGGWIWIGGVWAVPPGGTEWVAREWIRRGRGWVWVGGYWRQKRKSEGGTSNSASG